MTLVRMPHGPKVAIPTGDGAAAIARLDHLEARSETKAFRRQLERRLGPLTGRQWVKLRKDPNRLREVLRIP